MDSLPVDHFCLLDQLGLQRDEFRATAKKSIIAFVIYVLLDECQELNNHDHFLP